MANSSQTFDVEKFDILYQEVYEQIISTSKQNKATENLIANFSRNFISYLTASLNGFLADKTALNRQFDMLLKLECFKDNAKISAVKKDIDDNLPILKSAVTNVSDFIDNLQTIKTKHTPSQNYKPFLLQTGADQIAETLGSISLVDNNRTLIDMLRNSIEYYIDQKQYHLAVTDLRQILTIYARLANKIKEDFESERHYTVQLARTLKNLALLDNSKSYSFLDEAITLLKPLENRDASENCQLSACYAYLADLYEQDKQIEPAIQSYINSINILRQIKNVGTNSPGEVNIPETINVFSKRLCYLIYKLGIEAYQNKNYQQAIKHLQTAIDMKILHESLLDNCHRKLAKSYFYVADKLSNTPDSDLSIVISNLKAAVQNFNSMKELIGNDKKDLDYTINFLMVMQKQKVKMNSSKMFQNSNENTSKKPPSDDNNNNPGLSSLI